MIRRADQHAVERLDFVEHRAIVVKTFRVREFRSLRREIVFVDVAERGDLHQVARVVDHLADVARAASGDADYGDIKLGVGVLSANDSRRRELDAPSAAAESAEVWRN